MVQILQAILSHLMNCLVVSFIPSPDFGADAFYFVVIILGNNDQCCFMIYLYHKLEDIESISAVLEDQCKLRSCGGPRGFEQPAWHLGLRTAIGAVGT